MLRRFLELLARLCFRAPRATLVLASVPMLLLGFAATRAPVDLSFTGMVDQSSGPIADYFALSHEHDLGGYLLILVRAQEIEGLEGETEELRQRLDAAVARLTEELSTSPLIATVQPPTDPDWWIRNAAWLIDAELFDAAASVVAGDADPQRAAQLAQTVADAPLLEDPPGVRLVQVRMVNDPLEMAVGRWDFFEVEELVQSRVVGEFPELSIEFAGMPAVAAQDQAYTLGLVRKLTPLSLGLVLILFSLVERRWQSVLTVLWVLVLAMGATLGIVGLLTGGLTLMETFFGVTVFGLGVDFAVHLFVRFREERLKWSGVEDAVAATLRGTGRGVVAGAVTTAGAFLIVSLAPDPVAVHLGLSGGIGLLLCLVLMLLMLPAVWGLSEKDHAPAGTAPRQSDEPAGDAGPGEGLALLAARRLRFEKLSVGSVRHPRWALALSGAALLVAALGLLRFEFETDVSKVLNRNVESIDTVERIQQLYDLNGAPWIVSAESLDEARRVARAFRASPEFSYASSLADLLPEDPAEVERRRQRMLELRPRLEMLEGLLAGVSPELLLSSPAFLPLVSQLPEGTSAEQALLQLRRLMRALREAPELGPPTLDTLPAGMRGRFEGSSGDQLVLAYAKGSSLDGLIARQQREAAKAIHPEATSLSVLLETLMLGARPWIQPVAAGIVLFVAFVLLVDFRRPRAAVLALVPVVFGTGLTIGILCWLGVRFNIMTLTVLPLLCGLGVDDGIHVVHRMVEEGFRQPARSAAAVGRAVLMTTLTTCSSFAVLLLTDHPGLETMALVMLIGLPCCWLASVTTLPALATVLYPPARQEALAAAARADEGSTVIPISVPR